MSKILLSDREEGRPDARAPGAVRCSATGAETVAAPPRHPATRRPPAAVGRAVPPRRRCGELRLFGVTAEFVDCVTGSRPIEIPRESDRPDHHHRLRRRRASVAVVGILWIWRSTHSFESPRTDTTDTKRLAHGEKGWFVFAVAALGRAAAGHPRRSSPTATTPPRAASRRWRSSASSSPGRSRRPRSRRACRCASRSRAADVNHGFAVYNDDNVLLFQIQAVPDDDSHIVYTFKEPGRYQVVCLEFCGVNHHKMIGVLPRCAREPEHRPDGLPGRSPTPPRAPSPRA